MNLKIWNFLVMTIFVMLAITIMPVVNAEADAEGRLPIKARGIYFRRFNII